MSIFWFQCSQLYPLDPLWQKTLAKTEYPWEGWKTWEQISNKNNPNISSHFCSATWSIYVNSPNDSKLSCATWTSSVRLRLMRNLANGDSAVPPRAVILIRDRTPNPAWISRHTGTHMWIWARNSTQPYLKKFTNYSGRGNFFFFFFCLFPFLNFIQWTGNIL